MGHAAVNGVSGLGLLFVAGHPTTLLGPVPTGVVASLPWLAVVAWSFRRPERLAPAGR